MFITLDLTNVYGQSKIEIPEQKKTIDFAGLLFFQGRRKASKSGCSNNKEKIQDWNGIQKLQCLYLN